VNSFVLEHLARVPARGKEEHMYLAVTATGVVVGDPDDCTSLDVRAPSAGRPRIDETLREARIGAWDGAGEADINVAELRHRASAEGVTPGWAERWTAMIDYAQRKGWLSADGTTVRAHVIFLEE
jgi:hypothetical protein